MSHSGPSSGWTARGDERQRAWLFRWSNYDDFSNWFVVCNQIQDKSTYFIYGKEIGPETGVPHLQGYVYFKGPRLLGGLKRFHRSIHWIPQSPFAKPSDNQAYCKKEGDFVEFGRLPSQGDRVDLRQFSEDLRDSSLGVSELLDRQPAAFLRYGKWGMQIRENHLRRNPTPKDRFVVYLWGPTGSGKTSWVWTMYPDIYVLEPHPTSSSLWFDGYSYSQEMLMDDFRGSWMKFHYLLHLLDRYPMRVPIKCGFTQHTATMIIITSSKPPEELYHIDENMDQLTRRINIIVKFTALGAWTVTKGVWDISQPLMSQRTLGMPPEVIYLSD